MVRFTLIQLKKKKNKKWVLLYLPHFTFIIGASKSTASHCVLTFWLLYLATWERQHQNKHYYPKSLRAGLWTFNNWFALHCGGSWGTSSKTPVIQDKRITNISVDLFPFFLNIELWHAFFRNFSMRNLGKMFHTVEMMGFFNRLHGKVSKALK